MAAKCRHNDTHAIKVAVLKHMLPTPDDKIIPALTDEMKKDLCGFNHPQFARLLCPLSKLEDFDNNPQ
ncbi:MAG TPA: hypothetical protein VGO47_11640, partial [Chlamydiales bacterium]|nr:hypothetical protein [Chlamydiales bacterium]